METTAHNVMDFGLSAQQITKKFPGKTLWENWSFSIPSHSMTALTGPSGSGKTALLNCLGPPRSFRQRKCGLPGLPEGAQAVHKDHLFFRDVVRFLFQNYGLVENWTVKQNLNVAFNGATKVSKADRISFQMSQALDGVGLKVKSPQKSSRSPEASSNAWHWLGLCLKAEYHPGRRTHLRASTRTTARLSWTSCGQAQLGALVLISTHSGKIVSQCDQELAIQA